MDKLSDEIGCFNGPLEQNIALKNNLYIRMRVDFNNIIGEELKTLKQLIPIGENTPNSQDINTNNSKKSSLIDSNSKDNTNENAQEIIDNLPYITDDRNLPTEVVTQYKRLTDKTNDLLNHLSTYIDTYRGFKTKLETLQTKVEEQMSFMIDNDEFDFNKYMNLSTLNEKLLNAIAGNIEKNLKNTLDNCTKLFNSINSVNCQIQSSESSVFTPTLNDNISKECYSKDSPVGTEENQIDLQKGKLSKLLEDIDKAMDIYTDSAEDLSLLSQQVHMALKDYDNNIDALQNTFDSCNEQFNSITGGSLVQKQNP